MTVDSIFDWGRHDVPEDGEATVRLGPLSISFTRRTDELRLHWHRDGEPVIEPRPWSRWAAGEWAREFTLVPAFPDRPIVLKPEQEFRLLQGASARLYVRVPLHVEVRVRDEEEPPIVSIPSMIMSDTWWGSVEEGELAYWLPILGRRRILNSEFDEHLCICPLDLENRSGEDLRVEKIALRVEHLSIFVDGTRLWSDTTRVRYLGEDVGSRIDMAGRPPADAPDARLLAPARERLERGFTGRTFARLRSTLSGRSG